jgi:WD40 repeat protein
MYICFNFIVRNIIIEIDGRERSVLISSGGDGIIRFWNLHIGELIQKLDCSKENSEGVFAIKPNSNSSKLYAGDTAGWISIYSIAQSISKKEQGLINTFRAHQQTITSLDLIEKDGLIVTSSSDCSVRLFKVYKF